MRPAAGPRWLLEQLEGAAGGARDLLERIDGRAGGAPDVLEQIEGAAGGGDAEPDVEADAGDTESDAA